MHFKIKSSSDSVSYIFGGQTENWKIYDLVLTLEKKGEITEVNALLSRARMSPLDLLKMWKAMRHASSSQVFKFEVLPEHAKFYKLSFERVMSVLTKTFDGFESEIIYIHRDARVRAIFSKLSLQNDIFYRHEVQMEMFN